MVKCVIVGLYEIVFYLNYLMVSTLPNNSFTLTNN